VMVWIVMYRRFCMAVWSHPFLWGRGTPIPCRIDVGFPGFLESSRHMGGSLYGPVSPTPASNQPSPSHSSVLVPSYSGKTAPCILRLGVSYPNLPPSSPFVMWITVPEIILLSIKPWDNHVDLPQVVFQWWKDLGHIPRSRQKYSCTYRILWSKSSARWYMWWACAWICGVSKFLHFFADARMVFCIWRSSIFISV